MLARNRVGLAVMVGFLAHAATAAAEEPRRLQVAGPVEAPKPAQVAQEPGPEPREKAVVNLEAGTALVPGRAPGAYGRLTIEYLGVFDARKPSFAWGFWGGWEGFRGGGLWQLGFPLVFFAGVKSPKVLAAVGGGANLFGFGALDGKGGGGLLQPRAHARLGFDTGKVFLLATADVQYGWGWGHPVQPVVMTGVSVGFVFGDEAKRK